MKITLVMLEQLKACEDDLEKFEKLFGAWIEVTEANCIRCFVHHEFDTEWAAIQFLSADGLQNWSRIEKAAWSIFCELQRCHVAACNNSRSTAVAHGRTGEEDLQILEAGISKITESYNRTCAIAFWENIQKT